MKVSDFQKCLRAMAELISTKTPAKELTDAADALAPFAHYRMEKFAEFLKHAEVKYSATGELPDGKEPKLKKEPKAKTQKPPKPTPDQFTAKIGELKLALERGETLDRAAIETEVQKFDPMSQADIDTVMGGLGFPTKVKPKGKSLEAIVTHILAVRTASDRVKV